MRDVNAMFRVWGHVLDSDADLRHVFEVVTSALESEFTLVLWKLRGDEYKSSIFDPPDSERNSRIVIPTISDHSVRVVRRRLSFTHEEGGPDLLLPPISPSPNEAQIAHFCHRMTFDACSSTFIGTFAFPNIAVGDDRAMRIFAVHSKDSQIAEYAWMTVSELAELDQETLVYTLVRLPSG